MCYMTTHVKINNKRTYLQTFIPTGIKTKFNTCEMYLIARSGLFQSLGIAVAFLYCNSHRVSIRSILHPVDLIIRLKSSTGIFIFFYNMDMHLLPSRDSPNTLPNKQPATWSWYCYRHILSAHQMFFLDHVGSFFKVYISSSATFLR